MTLHPGDLIACGTSVGVLPMRPGMEVSVVIDGIGALTNRFEAASLVNDLHGSTCLPLVYGNACSFSRDHRRARP